MLHEELEKLAIAFTEVPGLLPQKVEVMLLQMPVHILRSLQLEASESITGRTQKISQSQEAIWLF